MEGHLLRHLAPASVPAPSQQVPEPFQQLLNTVEGDGGRDFALKLDSRPFSLMLTPLSRGFEGPVTRPLATLSASHQLRSAIRRPVCNPARLSRCHRRKLRGVWGFCLCGWEAPVFMRPG
ncbi:hypothetical protein MHYP_G00294790 [Metynnis hypsauchen]